MCTSSSSRPITPQETDKQELISVSHQEEFVPVLLELEKDVCFQDDFLDLPDNSETEPAINQDIIARELNSTSPGTSKEIKQKLSHQDEVVSVVPAVEEIISRCGGKPEFMEESLLQSYRPLNEQAIQELVIEEEFKKTPNTADGFGDCVKAKTSTIISFGFPNIGQTCYMNSSLQSLLTLGNFVKDFQRQKQVWCSAFDAQLIRKFMSIRDAHTSRDSNSKMRLLQSFKDEVSVEAPEFCGYEQNDAHEFLTSVLDQIWTVSPLLQDIAASMGTGYTCPVESNLVFKVENIRTCMSCGAESRRQEVFTNLSLDLVPGSCIEDMIQEYHKETELEYKCECGGRTSCQRSCFKTLPKVLILHMKRFRFTSSYDLRKVHDPIELQRDMVVSYKEDGACYSLVSVVSHLGYSGKAGHYICDGVNPDAHPDAHPDEPSDRWLTFNDAHVSETTGGSVCEQRKESAYILFYKKRE
ncbi:ubiquitin carboxyl-terminal hydrolase 37-like [Eleginops maclovinus]|uniref:ubiquitin carboxyl-terminal hydrolase 37-like n=1 Tax=Eleginops maclovinus TaxID=56733 RepID=UPI0030809A46